MVHTVGAKEMVGTREGALEGDVGVAVGDPGLPGICMHVAS
jgi:hypothetical protein